MAAPAPRGATGDICIALTRVEKHFGKTAVLHGIDLEIRRGELCVFVGPSGCGKSTLLRIIAGLETVSSGEVVIDGVRKTHAPASERGVAMVFQSYALYPHMTVRDNLAFGLKLPSGSPAGEAERRIAEAARMLEIDKLLDRLPRQLSGGQRQRVAIGRAITRQPSIFLLDEPLSNLDAALRVSMRAELSRLHHRLGATMVYVTHDQVEAMTLADRIVVLNAGRIEQVGAPMEIYARPRTRFAAGFLGSPKMNFLPGTIAASDSAGVTVRLDDGAEVKASVAGGDLAVDAQVLLGIRPEHVRVSALRGDAAGQLTSTVALVEDLGDHAVLHLDRPAADGHLMVKLERPPAAVGQRVAFELPASACHVFDSTGLALPRLDADR